ncbi:MAG: MFS transporter [Actinomycetota bacterium]
MTSSDQAAVPIDDGYKWRAFGAVGSFLVTAVLALTMVFLALPAMAEDFGVTLQAVSWVVIASSLTISALLLPFGRLADVIGRRRVHLVGLVLFAVGAAMTAAAGSFVVLIVARIVMSVGGAMAESVTTGILVSVFPDHERGKAIGAQTTSVAVGSALGPLAAGVALQFFDWRALFVVIVALTALSFVIAVVVLDEERISRTMPDNRPFDWRGSALSAAVVVLFVLTVNNPLGLDWLSWPIGLALVGLVAGTVVFVRWELSIQDPMLQLRFFADEVFRRAVVARVLGFTAGSAVFILVPIVLVSVRGMSEGRAGLTLFLNSVGLGVAAQLSGRLSDRLGARWFMVAGFTATTVAMLAFAAMSLTTPLWVVAAVSLLSGLALGTWNVPNNATVIGSVPPSSYGVVGAFTNLARNVGNVFGQAAVAAVVGGVLLARGFDIPLGDVAEVAGADDAFLVGWRAAFGVMAAFGALAALLALRIRPGGAPE